MSNSLGIKIMETMFEIQGYFATDIKKHKDRLIIDLEALSDTHTCNCGAKISGNYDTRIREIIIGSIFGNPVYARVPLKRIYCPSCGITTESVDIVEGKKTHSPRYAKEVTRITKETSNKTASKILGISDSKVYRIDKEELEKQIVDYRDKIPSLESVGVDEISIKKRHNYMTVLYNLDDSKVIWLEPNRKKEDLQKIFSYLGNKINRIKYITLDFWKAYEKAIKSDLPKAKLIYDKFHLSKILNRVIDEERRKYQNRLSDSEKREVKKQLRWFLLKRKKNLSKSGESRLKELKETNKPLYELYLLKEDFLSIFDRQKSVLAGLHEIIDWILNIQDTPYEALKSFGNQVLKRLDDLCNWFIKPISNGKVEGINNKIKTIFKQAYGYKDVKYLSLKVLQKCGYLYD